MNWTITLIICGLLVLTSGGFTLRHGSNHFRTRDFWAFVGSTALGIASIFYLPLYVACIWWLIATGAGCAPLIRAFKGRNDKKVFESPEIRYVEKTGKPGIVIPLNGSSDPEDDPPGAA